MNIDNNKLQIVFYYPSRNIGGAQILFTRIADELAKLSSYYIAAIDFQDGYISKNSKFIEIIEYTEKKICVITRKSIIISPLSMIDDIKHKVKLENGGSHLFWGLHPENTTLILKYAWFLKKYFKNPDSLIKILNHKKYNRIKHLITSSISERSIFFTDKTVKERTFNFYSIKEKYDEYVPIPIKNFLLENSNSYTKEFFNFAWIGRLDSDKIYSLLYIIEQLNSLETHNIKLIIIGDGDSKNKINTNIYNNLEIHFTGIIENDFLQSELSKWKIGLVFGMGTSVLESAIYKIPSIIIDASHKKIPKQYIPIWLYEAEHYYLGSYDLKTNHKRNSFGELIDEYINDYDNIANKCYNYTKNNHSLTKITQELNSYIIHASLKI